MRKLVAIIDWDGTGESACIMCKQVHATAPCHNKEFKWSVALCRAFLKNNSSPLFESVNDNNQK